MDLERRKKARKPVDLPGTCMIRLPSGSKLYGMITIQDISLSGLGIKLPENPEVEIGSVMNVIFNLDNDSRAIVQQSVVVRNIRGGRVIGAEFGPDEIVDQAIGAYMGQECRN